MSQSVVAVTDNGLVMAADSLVVQEEAGQVKEVEHRKKIYPLGAYGCITSMGAAVGTRLSQEVSNFVHTQTFPEFQQLVSTIESYLNRGYHQFLVENAGWFRLHPDARKILYFVIGGYCAQSDTFNIVTLESLDNQLPFRRVPTGKVLTMPRVLSTELKLLRMISQGCDLDKIGMYCLEELERISSIDPNVGGPFQVAILSKSGLEFLATHPI